MRPARDLVAAVRFLTRVPLPNAPRADAGGFGAAAFPLVGLFIGAAGVVVDHLAFAFPDGVRNVAVLATWALLTGALHYDGLADVLDAFGASGREERLRVMRDAAVGVFAVVGLVLLVATELAALAEIDGPGRAGALLAAPAIGRWAMVIAAVDAQSARPDGLGAEFVRALSARDVAVASVIALAVVALVPQRSGWIAFAAAAAGAWGVRLVASRAFGGVTGDVLGACGIVAETLALVVFAAR